MWFRGFALWPDEVGASRVADLLGNYGASTFVVGHTPQRDGRIHARFGGKVFLIDTGMLASHYQGGQPSALEIHNGGFTAIYPDQQIVLRWWQTDTRAEGGFDPMAWPRKHQ